MLYLTADVRDLAGNIYGQWKNDPSFMSLPKGPYVEKDLMVVHLQVSHNQKHFIALIMHLLKLLQGGLVREVMLPAMLTQPEKLHDVLSTLGGVRRIYTQTKNIL